MAFTILFDCFIEMVCPAMFEKNFCLSEKCYCYVAILILFSMK